MNMLAPVGKIIRIRNKFAGPRFLWVNTVAEALRKPLHMCFYCWEFQPGDPANCPISQQLFDFSRENGIGVILIRCPRFRSKIDGQADTCGTGD
jgi:hypothetical protein